MSTDEPGPSDEVADVGASGTSNSLGTEAIAGDIIQARDVQGGIHLHVGDRDSTIRRVVPRQLPMDTRIFVDREAELSRLDAGFAHSPESAPVPALLLVTGTAGVGKTALALRWAHRIRDHFRDGEIFVNLRGYDRDSPLSPSTALERILRDLEVPPAVIPTDLEARSALFRSLLARRRLLVFLDNASSAGQVRPLIPGSLESIAIVTSRNELSGLVVRDSAQRIELRTLRETDSVDLLAKIFASSGRADNTRELVQLAQLCANLPLALRVAAERAVSRSMVPLESLIGDLRDDSGLWDALSIGDEDEGEAVRTVFAWSYRSLSEDAATMFRSLGLHPGPDFCLVVAAVAAGIPARSARRSLDILQGAYLVENLRPNRFQLHDLLRAFALDESRSVDLEEDRVAALDRMLCWYIGTADNASRLIAHEDRFRLPEFVPPVEALHFNDMAEAVQWFEIERENLRSCVRSAHSHGLRVRTWQLAMTLGCIYMQLFALEDWRDTSELGVESAESLQQHPNLAAALDNRSKCALRRKRFVEAENLQQRVLDVRRLAGDEHGIAESLNSLGLINLHTRRLAVAVEMFSEAAVQFANLGDRRWELICRSNMAESLLESKEPERAFDLLQTLTPEFHDMGDRGLEGNALWLMSWCERLRGRLTSAHDLIEAALSIAEEAGNRVWEGFWLIEAAHIHLASGRAVEALDCCRMASSLQRQIGDRGREALALNMTGRVIRSLGEPADALGFHQQAARMHREMGEAWNEATSLAQAAECLRTLGRDGEERNALGRILHLTEGVADTVATGLRRTSEDRIESL